MAEPREFIITTKSEKQKTDNLDRFQKISTALSIAAIPIFLAIIGWILQNRLQNVAVSQKYVELALDIVKQPVDSTTSEYTISLREWAINLLNANSTVPFDTATSKSLSRGYVELPSHDVIKFEQIFEIPIIGASDNSLDIGSLFLWGRIFEIIQKDPTLRIRVEAHTGSDGPEAINLRISKQRAERFTNQLLVEFRKRYPERYDEISLKLDRPLGHGGLEPVFDNTHEMGRKLNRRITIRIYN